MSIISRASLAEGNGRARRVRFSTAHLQCPILLSDKLTTRRRDFNLECIVNLVLLDRHHRS